jgi:hypothetical protein
MGRLGEEKKEQPPIQEQTTAPLSNVCEDLFQVVMKPSGLLSKSSHILLHFQLLDLFLIS